MDKNMDKVKIRVMIADDHLVLAQGLESALNQLGFDVVNVTINGDQIVNVFLELLPDVLVLDLNLGAVKGLDVAADLLKSKPESKIVFYSQFDQSNLMLESYRIGGKGFVAKSSDVSEVKKAIYVAFEGGVYISDKVARDLALLSIKSQESPKEKLSSREFSIFVLMATGFSVPEIAARIDLSEKTIRVVMKSIKEILNIEHQSEVTKLALKYNLLKIDD